jgi:D-galactonate transporter
MPEVNKNAIVTRVLTRLMPMLFISYILAYIDRINIGFAALKMNAELGLSPYVFGLGAGVFFLGYFIFEIPSNLLLERIGARRWIARIMISWGVLSAGMAMVQGPRSFVIMRFLLGVAEAGFFPGVILYLTYWCPQEYRARVIGTFMVAIPVSLALGAPLSTAILHMSGGGLEGWQWIFICEGIPTVLLGVVFLAVMPDRPRDAHWLDAEERNWLQATIDSEHKAIAAVHGTSVLHALANPRVLALALIYFANTTAGSGLAFFLPQILKGLGLSDMQTGLMTGVPYVFGTLATLVFGYISDRCNERRWTLFAALALSGLGLIAASLVSGSLMAVAAIAVAAIGIYGTKAPFWPLPSMFLAGAAAAGGIALINSIGGLGGFLGPYLIGWNRQVTGSYAVGLGLLGGLAVVAAVLTPIIVDARFAQARVPR